jgi:hypothetical protein
LHSHWISAICWDIALQVLSNTPQGGILFNPHAVRGTLFSPHAL